jgi:hypothetical protein
MVQVGREAGSGVKVGVGVIEGGIGVKLGTIVAVTVGTGATTPQAANRTAARIEIEIMDARFDLIINDSVSSSRKGLDMVNLALTKETNVHVQAHRQD